jgi:hypothetical protein
MRGGKLWVVCLCHCSSKWSRSDRRTIPSGGDRRYTPAPEPDRRNTGDLRYGEPYLVNETEFGAIKRVLRRRGAPSNN